jgi:hypothetical protein
MIRNFRMLLMAATLIVAAAPGASAQTTTFTEVMFHWGAVHIAPGQALALNLELTDHFGEPLTLPVELQLEDKDGNVIYKQDVTISSGHAISFVLVIGPEVRTARSTIQGDIYGAVAPEVRLLQPCIKVILPPGPGTVDRMTPTLEVMDVVTGRVLDIVNNPHTIIGVLGQ